MISDTFTVLVLSTNFHSLNVSSCSPELKHFRGCAVVRNICLVCCYIPPSKSRTDRVDICRNNDMISKIKTFEELALRKHVIAIKKACLKS